MRTLHDGRRRTALGLALLALLGVAVWMGCNGNPAAPPLGPTGGLDSNCISDEELIQVVGDFTEPAWNIPVSPVMTLESGCVWSAVVRFQSAGEHLFKLVTDAAFDNPDDYGWNESQTLRVGVDNPVLKVSGTGTGIKIAIPVAGCYLIRFAEKDLTFRVDPTNCSTGGIRGTVEFENVAQPPLPRARVQALLQGAAVSSDSSAAADGTYEVPGLAAGTYDVAFSAFGYLDTLVTGVLVEESVVEIAAVRLRAGCVSDHDTIQVAGQMTTPPFDLRVSPYMTQVEGCRWEATLAVTAGTYLMKFVTDGVFDAPDDYGGDEASTLEIDTTHPVRAVSGTGTALRVLFPFDGNYKFVLDEENLTFRVESGGISGDLAGVLVFEGVSRKPLPVAEVTLVGSGGPVASTTSSPDDGTFHIQSVDAGIYDVRCRPPLRAPAHLDTTLAGVTVAGGSTNVGQVLVSRAPGGARGSVSFAGDASPPYPVASVVLRSAGLLADSVVTSATTGGWQSLGLKPGSYSVLVHASGYIDSSFTAGVARSVADLGDVRLEALVCAAYPDIETLRLAGKGPTAPFLNWNPATAPIMARLDRCRWEVSVGLDAAGYDIKFLSKEGYGGTPPDFAAPAGAAVVGPDTVATLVATEVPSISDAFRLRVPLAGVYRFRVDLDRLEFSYTRTGDLPATPKPRLTSRRARPVPAAPASRRSSLR
jgi:hypothetical protein